MLDLWDELTAQPGIKFYWLHNADDDPGGPFDRVTDAIADAKRLLQLRGVTSPAKIVIVSHNVHEIEL